MIWRWDTRAALKNLLPPTSEARIAIFILLPGGAMTPTGITDCSTPKADFEALPCSVKIRSGHASLMEDGAAGIPAPTLLKEHLFRLTGNHILYLNDPLAHSSYYY